MGTPDFAVGALEAIINAGHEVCCVVTQPDKAKGRSDKLIPSPVKECALSHGIEVHTPVKLRNPGESDFLKAYNADIFVVAAFGQILPKEVLEMPRFGCVNIHASLLPKYRGAAPIQQSILDGEEKTGVTIMQMDVGLDTGDILLQEEIAITDEMTGGSLFDALADMGAKMIVKALPLIEEGKVNPIKQDNDKATYAGMLKKETGHIDWSKSAAVIERLVRGCNPWPGTFTSFNGKQLKLWKTKVSDASSGEECGKITDVFKDHFDVATGEGCLSVYELQLEGKKRMSTEDFLRGKSIAKGDKLV